MKKITLFFFILGLQVAFSQVGIGTTNPQYTLDLAAGTFGFGSSNVRTETRNDAGISGANGAQSGFFETSAPTNYPAGSSSWWHLIEARHSNNSNNYALQIAGSFFDQDLWFRKTNDSGTTAWTQLLVANSAWKVLGNSGTDPTNNFLGTLDNQHLVFRTNNTERARILSSGNFGIGTTAPTTKLHVVADSDNLPTIYGINTNSTASTTSYGVRGECSSTGLGSAGISGVSVNSGQNEIGVLGDYATWGAAVFGLGWASSFGDMPTNRDFGLFATCNYSTGTGVYARDMNDSSGSYAFYGTGKFAVTGSKSASVPTTKGNQLLYCTESPEIWFEDLGGGKLTNGSTHITLDEMFLETVFIDENHKIRVFIQEEGESNGLIVIKDADGKGFTVKEKNEGLSDIEFSYRIMAKRRFYQDQRFGVDSNQPFGNNLIDAKDAPLITRDPQEMMQFVEKQKQLKESQNNQKRAN